MVDAAAEAADLTDLDAVTTTAAVDPVDLTMVATDPVDPATVAMDPRQVGLLPLDLISRVLVSSACHLFQLRRAIEWPNRGSR